MNKFEFKNLTPFKWFVLENFPFIEADFDALTEWQLFCKLGKEINKIIDSQNIVGEQAETLTNAFNNLKNYVDNYFENLDVQDEINNKLNEMAEDGTLQEIISAYLNSKAIFGFDNVEEMKNATNLIDGSYARTLGKNQYNDGYGAFYKIRNITTDDVIDNENIIKIQNSNTLIAEKIKTYLDKFYEDLTVKSSDIQLVSSYDYDVNCYYNLLKIPKNNFKFSQLNKSPLIPMYRYLKENNIKNKIYANGQLAGIQVINGNPISNALPDSEYWYILGIKNNNVSYKKDITRTITANELVNEGYTEAFGIWHPILLNNEVFDYENELPTSDTNYDYIINRKHTRTIFAYDEENYYILVVEGRLGTSEGIDFLGEVTICQNLNLKNSFNMDGGGSSQLWFTNEPYNCVFSDSSMHKSGYSSRQVFAYLEFKLKEE